MIRKEFLKISQLYNMKSYKLIVAVVKIALIYLNQKESEEFLTIQTIVYVFLSFKE